MLHGREREIEILRAHLRAARHGAGFAVVLAGEAGIGKTALLEELLGDATAFRVLRARGFESEAEIPYAGLLEVVRPLLDLAEALPEQQAAALRSALALGPATPHDRFAVPVAVLGLLGAAAESRPLLVVIDDAHWLDAASREALLFAARRLQSAGAGMVLAVRSDPSGPAFDTAGLEVVELAGLDAAGARALLRERVVPSVADALAAATGGNPLALVELPAALSEDERRGIRPISTPLPAAGRVEELFSAQVAALPDATRRAVGVAAAVDDGALGPLLEALEALGLGQDDLGPAEQAGVVSIRGARMTFRHPLVRAAAYAAQTAAERSATHDALADASPDARAAAWHRAQATTRPDEDVARALAEAADDALLRGGRAEAARTYARAADLTPDATVAVWRRLAAAGAAHDAGDGELADALLDAAEAGPLGDDARGQARRVRALLLLRAGNTAAGVRILEEEAGRLAGADPVQAAWTLLLTAPGFMHSGDFVALRDVAVRARALAGDADPAAADLASDTEALALNSVSIKRPEDPPSAIDGSSRPITGGLGEVVLASAEGLVLHERWELAGELLDRHVDDARREGAILMLLYALAVRAHLRHRTGRWAEARADAEEAVGLQRVVGQDTIFSAYVFATAAIIAVDTGDLAGARELAEASMASARRSGAVTIRLWSHWALGRLLLAEDRPEAAADELDELARLQQQLGWAPTNAVFDMADRADALLAVGREEDARRLAEHMRHAAGTGQRLPLAVAARVEAAIAGDDDGFAEAATLHDGIPVPFERARTLLAHAAWRRSAAVGDVAEPAREALAVFERLGAAPWAARAREELRKAGSRSTASPDADPALVLSGQEWRVAELVARGLTNREVGGELFLSPKTIEHHLSAIYRKLGVRSRTELTAVLPARVG